MEPTNINLLRQQIPTTILSEIDAAEDRQTIKRYSEARERGENPEGSPEYLAAIRRCARMLREKRKAAGDYHETPEILAESVSRLIAGRAHNAAGARAWQAAIGPKPKTEQPVAVPAARDLSKFSNEELERMLEDSGHRINLSKLSDEELERRLAEARRNEQRKA